MKQRTNEEYLENYSLCPYCNSGNLDWSGGFDFEENYFFQKVLCNDCEKSWDDKYVLTGYVPRE